MAGTSTAMCTSFKQELPQTYHNFLTSAVVTGSVVSGSYLVSGLGSLVGLAVGMPMSGAGVQATTVAAAFSGAAGVVMSLPGSATGTVGITFAGDLFSMALVKVSPTGTYGAATTNYSNLTGNADEVSGAGYSAGGFAWTGAQNISPAITGTTAFWSWSVNPSWTSATFSCTGGIIYNTSNRAPTNNRSVSVHDFGGTQTVSAGTFTVILPTNNSSTAILRIA